MIFSQPETRLLIPFGVTLEGRSTHRHRPPPYSHSAVRGDRILLLQSSVDGRVAHVPLWAPMDDAAVDIHMWAGVLCERVFVSLGCIPGSGIAGTRTFSSRRSSGCTISRSLWSRGFRCHLLARSCCRLPSS